MHDWYKFKSYPKGYAGYRCPYCNRRGIKTNPYGYCEECANQKSKWKSPPFTDWLVGFLVVGGLLTWFILISFGNGSLGAFISFMCIIVGLFIRDWEG